jgi:hypothetical protein
MTKGAADETRRGVGCRLLGTPLPKPSSPLAPLAVLTGLAVPSPSEEPLPGGTEAAGLACLPKGPASDLVPGGLGDGSVGTGDKGCNGDTSASVNER